MQLIANARKSRVLRSEIEPGMDHGIVCSAQEEGHKAGRTAGASRLSAAANRSMAISKVDAELQIVTERSMPGFPDSQGDYMTRETIREMAFEFMLHRLRLVLH
jgi:hypothetical protein